MLQPATTNEISDPGNRAADLQMTKCRLSGKDVTSLFKIAVAHQLCECSVEPHPESAASIW